MTKLIGYFKSNEEPYLPMPILMDNDKQYIDGFTDKCKEWLLEYEKSKPITNNDGSITVNTSLIIDDRWIEYNGCSECRICNKNNGSLEYNYCGFRFPIGIFHYILDHKIKIPTNFQNMIANEPVMFYKNLKRRSMYENMLLISSSCAGLSYCQ